MEPIEENFNKLTPAEEENAGKFFRLLEKS